MGADPFRVAIVNDLTIAVTALRRLVEAQSDLELAWIAHDGKEAVERAVKEPPDLILMDLVMPVMDGVEATKRIMQDRACPILVVTATVDGNLSKVYNALGAGALDAVEGPTMAVDGSLKDADRVIKKIRTIRRLHGGKARSAARSPTPPAPPGTPAGPPQTGLVVLGASTGGPDAVARVLAALPEPAPFAVVLVQHLDVQFVPGLVEWLRAQTHRDVRPIKEGETPTVGVVHVAATNDHLVLERGRFAYTPDPEDLPYRPSVDVFFSSLARGRPRRGVAIVLTGMGRDGAEGLLALRQAGWATLAQDEGSSVVYGMPKAATRNGAAELCVAIDEMGDAIGRAWKRVGREEA